MLYRRSKGTSHRSLLVNKMERTTRLLALSGKILIIVVLACNVLVEHPAWKPTTSDCILLVVVQSYNKIHGFACFTVCSQLLLQWIMS